MPAKAPGAANVPAPPASIDRTPIVADLSKVRWGDGPPELFGWEDGERRLFFYTNGTGTVTATLPADGEYHLIITAASQPALNEHAKFKVEVDGRPVGTETTCQAEEARDYLFPISLSSGERKISVSFTNDVYKENEYDRNFYLHGVRLVRTK